MFNLLVRTPLKARAVTAVSLAVALLVGGLALTPVGFAEPLGTNQVVGPGGVREGLLAWFDASDPDADGDPSNDPTEGSSFSSWVSRVPGGFRAEQVSGKNPATYVVADGINGLPTLRFTRVNDSEGSILRIDNLDLRASVTEDTTIFTVFRPRSRATNNGVWGIDNGNWDRFFLSYIPFFGDTIDDGLVSLGPAQAGAVVDDAGQIGVVRLLTIAYDGNVRGTVNAGPTNGSAAYFNGELIRRFTDSTHPTDAQRSLAIGWDGDNSVYDGDIAELIVFDRVLTDQELRDVNFYLSQKYDFPVAGPGTVPGPPTNLVATPSGTSASIAFTAGPDGGSPITGYEYSLDGGRTWLAANPAITSSPLEISGIVRGEEYKVIVRAVNAIGPGDASEAVRFILASVPDAPINLVASGADGAAEIVFTETDDGGSPITNYEYRVNGGSWEAFGPAKVSSPVVVRGLTNNAAVSIELRALNAIGAGAASSPVVVTPAAPVLRPPSAPLDLVAVPADGQATVTFTEPLDPGDRPINGYEYSVDGGRTWTPLASPPPPGTAATVTGLSNGVVNEIALRATSQAGAGESSRPVESLFAVPPAAPFDVVVFEEEEGVTIVFSDGDDGGSPITDHEYSINGGEWLSFPTPQNSSPVTVSGLEPGVPLTVQVRAVNAVGPGAASPPVSFTPLGPPSPPVDLGGVRSGSTVSLQWNAPINTGGRPVTGYLIEMASSQSGPWVPAGGGCAPGVAGVSPLTSCTFDEPKLGIGLFRVKAINDVGTSDPSDPLVIGCPVAANPFGDVRDGVWFTLPVACIAERSITTGWGGSDSGLAADYRPGISVTRAQMVAALWRKAGRPSAPIECSFTDIPAGVYWETAACWALASGITGGVGGDPTTFAPGAVVTRAQMAAFLWRAVEEPSGSPLSPFADVPESAYYADAVDWLAAGGIVAGVGGDGTSFAPANVLTRAQMAAVLYRLGALQGEWASPLN